MNQAITAPLPDEFGDTEYPPPLPQEKQPQFVNETAIRSRWGMGRKLFKVLVKHGVIRPRICAGRAVLYASDDVFRVEREGWTEGGPDQLPPAWRYPVRPGEREPMFPWNID